MTYTVVEVTEDGSVYNTSVTGKTKDEAEAIAKEWSEEDPHRSLYYAEEEAH